MQIMRARLASGTQYAVAYSVQDGFDSVRQWEDTEIAYLVLQNVFLVV